MSDSDINTRLLNQFIPCLTMLISHIPTGMHITMTGKHTDSHRFGPYSGVRTAACPTCNVPMVGYITISMVIN